MQYSTLQYSAPPHLAHGRQRRHARHAVQGQLGEGSHLTKQSVSQSQLALGHVASSQPITAHLDSQHAQLGVLVADENEEDNEGDDGDGEDLHMRVCRMLLATYWHVTCYHDAAEEPRARLAAVHAVPAPPPRRLGQLAANTGSQR